jgi:Tfp pilus assembly protein PilF
MPPNVDDKLRLALEHLIARRLSEADKLFREILLHQPRHPAAMMNLGVIANLLGRNDVALEMLNRTIDTHPKFANAHYWLANVLRDMGRIDESIAEYHRAIALNPDLVDAHTNLGDVLKTAYKTAEAVTEFQKAVALVPDSAEAHHNLALALKEDGRFPEAVTACRKAIALRPDYNAAHLTLSLLLLTQGEFQEAWKDYGWRWKHPQYSSREFAQPRWDGSSFEGRTLLLHNEQGFGDAIHLVRFLPQVAERGGRLIVECRPELGRLFRQFAPYASLTVSTQPLPPFDLHCPLMDLLPIFGIDLSNIPGNTPYLKAPPEEVEKWRARLRDHGECLKIGLVWAGSSTNRNDRNRSIPLEKLAPLARVPGVHFFSLQKGQPSAQAKNPPARMNLTDWTPELNDFADTAALIENLDLILTVDTSTAHLAGALNKPAWVMLPMVPDWRWLLGREDSPWYPTMRLFRQRVPGDWSDVVNRLAAALERFLNNGT